jgi:hypothetical protein
MIQQAIEATLSSQDQYDTITAVPSWYMRSNTTLKDTMSRIPKLANGNLSSMEVLGMTLLSRSDIRLTYVYISLAVDGNLHFYWRQNCGYMQNTSNPPNANHHSHWWEQNLYVGALLQRWILCSCMVNRGQALHCRSCPEAKHSFFPSSINQVAHQEAVCGSRGIATPFLLAPLFPGSEDPVDAAALLLTGIKPWLSSL